LREAALRADPKERSKRAFACLLLHKSDVLRLKRGLNLECVALERRSHPMDFVVDAIEKFFDMDIESARRLMLRVHNDGIAECGAYSHEMAKTKAALVIALAREHRHPLQCVIERKRKCCP
jgi:ATP-dependent Clp protease adapter protein ClpS